MRLAAESYLEEVFTYPSFPKEANDNLGVLSIISGVLPLATPNTGRVIEGDRICVGVDRAPWVE